MHLLVGVVSFVNAVIAYALTPAQIDATRLSIDQSYFDTPTEAAFAAARLYGTSAEPNFEIGAVIYLDMRNGVARYSYGPMLTGQIDEVTADSEILYDTSNTAGNQAIVGLWHQHPLGSSWDSLRGHIDEIAATHQTIWTTIAHSLYVQYWSDGRVRPLWAHSMPAIPPVCTRCV